MAGLTGFVLPMLLGLLGAFTYVYRDLDRRVQTATLVPGDSLHGTLRMLLGTILGGLLGVVWTTGQPIQLEGVALSLTALAFFVGYSVEVVFQTLDTIISKVAGAIGKIERPLCRVCPKPHGLADCTQDCGGVQTLLFRPMGKNLTANSVTTSSVAWLGPVTRASTWPPERRSAARK